MLVLISVRLGLMALSLGWQAMWFAEAVSMYTFSTTTADINQLTVLESHPGLGHVLQCAVVCGTRMSPPFLCQGFHFDADQDICQVFNGTIEEAASGIRVYKNSNSTSQNNETLGCPQLQFQEVISGAEKFYYASTDTEMSYEEARLCCRSEGAYLLHFDMPAEYSALDVFLSGIDPQQIFWVGANDVETEGVWITDRDGGPMDANWLWAVDQPSGGIVNEIDCASLKRNDLRLRDKKCHKIFPFICERDP